MDISKLSGCALVHEEKSQQEIRLLLTNEGGGVGHSFSFDLSNVVVSQTINVIIMNAQLSRFHQGWKDYSPFFKYPETEWERVENSKYVDGIFSFEILPLSSKLSISWYPRYATSRLEEFMSSIGCRDYLSNVNKGIWHISAGDVIDNSVILISGQHPGESMSAYFLEGFLFEYFKGDMRKSYSLNVFPFFNIDGLKKGNHRLDSSGRDYNRSWDDDDIQAIRKVKSIVSRLEPPSLFIDVHGDEVSKIDYAMMDREREIYEQLERHMRDVFFIKSPSKFKRYFKLVLQKGKLKRLKGQTASRFFSDKMNCPSLTIELSAHRSEPDRVMELGKSFAHALIKFYQP